LCCGGEDVEHAVEEFRVEWPRGFPEDDAVVIRSDQMARRSAPRASRKLGVVFFGYQDRGIQFRAAPWVGMYQVQMAA
jgi:hypothetical protein